MEYHKEYEQMLTRVYKNYSKHRSMKKVVKELLEVYRANRTKQLEQDLDDVNNIWEELENYNRHISDHIMRLLLEDDNKIL